MAKEKFPKKLYVYKEKDGEDTYLLCYETPRECADLQEDRLVGIYELVGIGKVAVNVEVQEGEAG